MSQNSSKNSSGSRNPQSSQKSSRDKFLWILIFILVVAGIAANSYYDQLAGALRAAGGIVLVLILLGIAALTTQGKKAWSFVKAARGELRKVVWPTRQETVQTTVIVIAMVIVAAIILWGLDSIFLWAISWLTGQRG